MEDFFRSKTRKNSAFTFKLRNKYAFYCRAVLSFHNFYKITHVTLMNKHTKYKYTYELLNLTLLLTIGSTAPKS